MRLHTKKDDDKYVIAPGFFKITLLLSLARERRPERRGIRIQATSLPAGPHLRSGV